MAAVDTTLVVLVPESGDEIQMMKAGIIEIADLFVVNKSDREGASKLRLVLEQLLELKEDRSQWRPLVTQTCATSGEGVEELYTHLMSHREHLANTGRQAEKKRHRARQQVERLVDRETITAFWTAARREILERELDNMSPYELTRLIRNET
jgi:LAO/AO transport system kinase